MSIFSIFTISRQGLFANQRAISVTANNIANVNTPGYTRQRPIFESIASTSLPDGFPAGGGSQLSRVERVIDLAIEAQLHRERQGFAFDQAMESGLASIEGIFEELGGSGITTALSAFFAALNDLATNPSQLAARENVIQSGATLVSLIHDADRRLAQQQIDANLQIQRNVQEINTIALDIANLNERIFQDEIGDHVASALRDRRANRLADLAEKIDFTSFERADGRVTVFVAGGFLLVDAATAATLETTTVQPTPLPDPSFVNIFHNLDGSVAGPITGSISSSELGGNIELRDNRLAFYRAELDRFAFTLSERINNVHAAGSGLDDGSSRNFFIDPAIGGPNPPGDALATVAGAASAIQLNPAIVANSRHIAAGTAAGAAAAGDNTNALALADVESAGLAFSNIGDAAGAPTGNLVTLGDFFDSLSGRLGTEIQATRRGLEQGDLVISELENRRGAISGVSIDEEVTNLVRYQRAFQANARIISVVDELLQQLLQI